MIIWSEPPAKQGHQEHIAQDGIQADFEYFQRRGLKNSRTKTYFSIFCIPAPYLLILNSFVPKTKQNKTPKQEIYIIDWLNLEPSTL